MTLIKRCLIVGLAILPAFSTVIPLVEEHLFNVYGLATPEDSLPCYDAKADVFTETPNFSTAELYNLTSTFLDNFMYPKNLKQAHLINSTFLASNILGRVDATRTFDGPELNTEYLFGLFAGVPANDSTFFTLLGVPVSYEIKQFSGNGNIVSVSLINTFNVSAVNATIPIEVHLWLTLNSDRQISQYDATFRYLAWEFATLLEIGQKRYHLPSALLKVAVTQKIATSICDIAQASCKGPDQQYSSKAACMAHLMTQVRFGEAHELGMNTLLCRMVHQGMVPLRPSVHCSHVGPSGGAYCIDDRTYAGTVEQKYFTNAPFVPDQLH